MIVGFRISSCFGAIANESMVCVTKRHRDLLRFREDARLIEMEIHITSFFGFLTDRVASFFVHCHSTAALSGGVSAGASHP